MNNRKPLKCDWVARVVASNFRLQSLVFFGAIFKTGERKIQWRDDFSRRRIFALRWPDKIESLSCHSFRKKHTNMGTLSLRGKRFVRFGGKEREQESKTVIFWLISRASKTGLCFSLLRNQTETLATQARER